MRPSWIASLAMCLALIPVTLLVPGLNELVVERHGGTEVDAHAFMTVNMLAGVVAVPVLMRRLHRLRDLRTILGLLLALDAVAFLGMGRAGGLATLYAFRVMDGAVHLPAVTLLMVAANRMAGTRKGASLGALASALMLGVTIGSPLGGWLVRMGPWPLYATGAAIFAAAAALCLVLPPTTAAQTAGPRGSRYRWGWRQPESWPPLAFAFMDRFSIGVFVSTFTLFLAREHQVDPATRGVLVALFMIPFAALCYPVGRLAERVGWLPLLVGGNVLFGLTYGSYGLVPASLLPAAMIVSGIASAFVFAPSLVLVSDLAKAGHGEGLFGVFQVAGTLGFLAGPIAGGLAVAWTGASGRPAYELIFGAVGLGAVFLAAAAWVVLRQFGAAVRRGRTPAAAGG
jgi:MFS family permease